MQTVVTVGLDIAKNVFQAHGVDGEGVVVFRRRITRAKVREFFGRPPAMPRRHRGLRQRSSLGARDKCARAHG
jgi:hypothetical protein